MTLADFFAGTEPGIPLSSATTVIGPDHLARVTWPGTIVEPGFWWAITEVDGTVLTAGWTIGKLLDTHTDIARGLARIARSRGTEAVAC